MYPNQSPQIPTPTPPLAPTDYMNQIAPRTPKRPLGKLSIRQVLMVGGGLIIAVIILAIIVNTVAAGKRDPLEHLSARLTSTQTVVTTAQANLKSSKLKSLNGNLTIYMTNTNRDVSKPLLLAGINTTKLSKAIVAGEATTALTARLEDARLNAVYDRTYAREMTYQLGTLLTLMKQIYNGSGNTELKTFLKSAYDNLRPTQESFANFSASE